MIRRRKRTDLERLQDDFRTLQADAAILTRDARSALENRVSDGLDQVATYAGHTARCTGSWLQSRPFSNLAGAFALGIAVGTLALRRAAPSRR